MNIFKRLPLIAFVALMSMGLQANAIQSYKEWKSGKVQDAQAKIASLKAQLEIKKQLKREIAQKDSSKDPNLAINKNTTEASSIDTSKVEMRLQQESYNLDLAKDLTVSDYFAGYLIKVQDKKAAFNEVAGKLSPDEVAELMTAYANSVFGTHPVDVPMSAADFTRNAAK